MSAHTATPWNQDGAEKVRAAFPCAIEVKVKGEAIAHVNCGWGRGEANAALIVRAVNSHDALVAALEAMMARVDGEVAYGDTWEEMAAASAALAQATTNPRASAEE